MLDILQSTAIVMLSVGNLLCLARINRLERTLSEFHYSVKRTEG